MANYPQSAFLKWECGPTANSAYLSYPYTKGTLNMGAVLSGTPVNGTACSITVKAKNFEFKSGTDEVELRVPGANFGTTQIIPVTPKTTYEGKTLEFFVALTAHRDSVIYANVGW